MKFNLLGDQYAVLQKDKQVINKLKRLLQVINDYCLAKLQIISFFDFTNEKFIFSFIEFHNQRCTYGFKKIL